MTGWGGPLRARCLQTALLAVLLVVSWQALTVHFNYGGNWTALFCTGSLQRIPPDLAPDTYVFQGSTGYDGQFYRYIALDPSPTGRYADYVDDPRLRYRRILLPGLAHVLGFGTFAGAALIGLVVVSAGLGVYWTSAYFRLYGKPAEWGLLFLIVPATLTSIDRMLLDGALLAVFAGFLLYVQERRWGPLVAICVVAPLVRDTGLFLCGAAAVHFLWRREHRRALIVALTPLPALAWWVYVHVQTPPSQASEIFGIPFIGILERLFVFRTVADPVMQTLIRVTDTLALLALLAALVLGVRELRRPVIPAGTRAAVGAFVLLGAVLVDSAHLTEPYGFTRPVSPLLLALLVGALVRGPKINLLPPLAMAATVGLSLRSQALGVLEGITGWLL